MIRIALPYIIRPMEAADVPTVVAIDRLSFPTPWSASSYLYELSHSDHSFYNVLEPAGVHEDTPPAQGWRRWLRAVAGFPATRHVIGYAGFRRKGPANQAHISTIAIHPNWRGNGLGELLLLATIERSLALHLDTITLEVRPSNRTAQNLYRKYGFRFQGVQRAYYRDGEDALLMKVRAGEPAYAARLAALREALETRLCRLAEDVGQNRADTL